VLFASVALIRRRDTVAFGLSTSLPLSLAALAVRARADMVVSVVVRMSLVQLETPDDMRGRVGAVTRCFIGASNQIGEFESGRRRRLARAVVAVVAGGVGTLAVVGCGGGGSRRCRRDRLDGPVGRLTGPPAPPRVRPRSDPRVGEARVRRGRRSDPERRRWPAGRTVPR
jgi:hypothetical protein